MTNEEILEGNKLIAEFMGGKLVKSPCGIHVGFQVFSFDNGPEMPESWLKYNIYWDWLMPVVEKMEDMGYCFTSDPWSHQLIEYGSGDEKIIITHEFDSKTSKIEDLYYTVILFIKWHNQQTK